MGRERDWRSRGEAATGFHVPAEKDQICDQPDPNQYPKSHSECVVRWGECYPKEERAAEGLPDTNAP
eukprot:1555973-Rhodomonas_salina.3